MKKIKEEKEIYQFRYGEVLKALGLKIPRSKEIHFNTNYDYDNEEHILELEIKDGKSNRYND